MNLSELVSIDTLCERYGCDRHTASRIIHKLPWFKVGRTLFARCSDLEDWERGQMNYPVRMEKRRNTVHYIERRRA